jgi:hypothetical protein
LLTTKTGSVICILRMLVTNYLYTSISRFLMKVISKLSDIYRLMSSVVFLIVRCQNRIGFTLRSKITKAWWISTPSW